jgi:hypothetical protein
VRIAIIVSEETPGQRALASQALDEVARGPHVTMSLRPGPQGRSDLWVEFDEQAVASGDPVAAVVELCGIEGMPQLEVRES